MSLAFSPNPVIDESLVFYLDAANVRSYDRLSTNWLDLGKNRKNGILTNGPTFDPGNGGSILLDTVDDYVSIPDPVIISAGSDFTLSMFVKPTFAATDPGVFRDAVSDTSFYFTSTTLFPRVIWCGTSILAPGSGWSGSPDAWAHYTLVVRSETDVKLYENATLQHQASHAKATTQISISQFGYQTSTDQKVGGNWASIQVYNRALDIDEIRRNFNALGGRFGLWV